MTSMKFGLIFCRANSETVSLFLLLDLKNDACS